jgi:hypothetical protein
LALAIARVDGMPHLELIFLHSENADGCNAQRARPSVSSDLKIASNSDRLHRQIPDAIEDDVQEALAILRGDAIAALRITLIANAFLKS